MRQTKRFFALSSLTFLILVVVAGCSGGLPEEPAALLDRLESAASSASPALPAVIPPRLLAAKEGTLEQVYAEVSPSVVHIQVLNHETESAESRPQVPGFPELPNSELPRSGGEGSGFVWDKKGHIITNNHVVENADEITIIFADDTMVEAEIVGADPDSDLAVLKVDLATGQLQPVQIGDSAKLQVGELAIAIGNPFGQEGTMTVGIISALGRLLPIEAGNPFAPRYNIPDVIQTDAAINPGNSGGVLLNGRGEVIGVTTAIISDARSSSGIGFAVPSAIVKKVVPTLISDGHYQHAFLGISGGSLTPELAEAMELPAGQRGVLVAEIVPDGPAEKAGLLGSDLEVEIDDRPVSVGGDVIIAIDEQPIDSMDDLITYLARHTEVGKKADLILLRDGEEVTKSVKLAARPKREAAPVEPMAAEAEEGIWLGIFGLPLTPDLAEAIELKADQPGLLIQQIEPGSPADEAGLIGSYKPIGGGIPFMTGGDIIVTIDGNPISGPQDLPSVLADAESGDELTLKILRNGEEVEVTVTLTERPTE